MIFVLAGSESQAARWAGYQGYERDQWRYLDAPAALASAVPPVDRVVYAQGWQERPDLGEFDDARLARLVG